MSYNLEWSGIDGIVRIETSAEIADMGWSSPWAYAQWLNEHGVTDIIVWYKGEIVDNIVQGRSQRNFPMLSITERPGTSRRFKLGRWTLTLEREAR